MKIRNIDKVVWCCAWLGLLPLIIVVPDLVFHHGDLSLVGLSIIVALFAGSIWVLIKRNPFLWQTRQNINSDHFSMNLPSFVLRIIGMAFVIRICSQGVLQKLHWRLTFRPLVDLGSYRYGLGINRARLLGVSGDLATHSSGAWDVVNIVICRRWFEF